MELSGIQPPHGGFRQPLCHAAQDEIDQPLPDLLMPRPPAPRSISARAAVGPQLRRDRDADGRGRLLHAYQNRLHHPRRLHLVAPPPEQRPLPRPAIHRNRSPDVGRSECRRSSRSRCPERPSELHAAATGTGVNSHHPQTVCPLFQLRDRMIFVRDDSIRSVWAGEDREQQRAVLDDDLGNLLRQAFAAAREIRAERSPTATASAAKLRRTSATVSSAMARPAGRRSRPGVACRARSASASCASSIGRSAHDAFSFIAHRSASSTTAVAPSQSGYSIWFCATIAQLPATNHVPYAFRRLRYSDLHGRSRRFLAARDRVSEAQRRFTPFPPLVLVVRRSAMSEHRVFSRASVTR